MSAQALLDLEAAVTKAETVMESATTLISGIPSMIDAAVQAALANGATAEELAPLAQLSADVSAKADALAAAVTANTPAAEPPANP